jgi:hypothetical protein
MRMSSAGGRSENCEACICHHTHMAAAAFERENSSSGRSLFARQPRANHQAWEGVATGHKQRSSSMQVLPACVCHPPAADWSFLLLLLWRSVPCCCVADGSCVRLLLVKTGESCVGCARNEEPRSRSGSAADLQTLARGDTTRAGFPPTMPFDHQTRCDGYSCMSAGCWLLRRTQQETQRALQRHHTQGSTVTKTRYVTQPLSHQQRA